jgi:8-amino-3,8-dideoxy-alpha-D-manno-octulosonate transaminase
MRIFNSLGSNYDLATIMATLLIDNGDAHSRELVDYLQKRYGGDVYLTYKCREAMVIGLKLLQLSEGSQVAVTGFTCIAVENAIKEAGLEPVFLDVDNTLNFTAATLKKTLQKNKKIKVVIVQNTLGRPVEMVEVKQLCQQYKVYLVEDLAHSIGTKYAGGAEAGTVGDVVMLSFSQDKVADSVSGGALVVRKRELRRKPLQDVLRLHKMPIWQQAKDRFYPIFTGLIRVSYDIYLGKILHKGLKMLRFLSNPLKYTPGGEFNALPNWQAGLAMNGYIDLEVMQTHREKIARIYMEKLNKALLLGAPLEKKAASAWLRLPVIVPENRRDGLLEYLEANGFSLRDIWYDVPVAPRKLAATSSYEVGMCPQAEKLCQQIVNLPTHRQMTTELAEKLAELINEYLSLSQQERDNLSKK